MQGVMLLVSQDVEVVQLSARFISLVVFTRELLKARRYVYHRTWNIPATFLLLSVLLALLAACGGSTTTPPTTGNETPALSSQQVLRFPNVGISDSASLDPALGPDANTGQIVSMIYSGLVKSDINLNVIPDQATWDVSPDNKVFTFHLKPNITFSDGTPVTAQTYVYTLTRALLPEVKSGIASFFEGAVVGADAVSSGKTKILTGVKALDDTTLQITLTHPTPYFLEVLTNSLYFPLNKSIIDQYGQGDWPESRGRPGRWDGTIYGEGVGPQSKDGSGTQSPLLWRKDQVVGSRYVLCERAFDGFQVIPGRAVRFRLEHYSG